MSAAVKISDAENAALLDVLQARFMEHMNRHEALEWTKIQEKLEARPDKLLALRKMENSGGEPDVVAYDKASDEYIFCDCSAESPAGRRSLCYDEAALASRKENKPRASALGMAKEMGASILSEAEYRALQELGVFDLKSSTWIQTPEAVRKQGGAFFCNRRYDRTFLYYNGADAYYAARGFRASLRL